MQFPSPHVLQMASLLGDTRSFHKRAGSVQVRRDSASGFLPRLLVSMPLSLDQVLLAVCACSPAE
ncbi:hypothetical protein NDU88_002054, partial [Pleurodeles waltl]